MKEIFIFLVLLHFSESTFAKDECFKGKCSLEVDGHQYFSGECRIDTGDFGLQFSGKSKYFASISHEDNGDIGYWNGKSAESHADDDLGELKKLGECWVNQHAKICIIKKVSRKCDF